MPWTEKQEQVIKERNKTILVSAAAGSGKTATLVERIYQKIDRASRLAASGARLDAVRNGDLPGARVCACGKNADGNAVLVGYIPATTKED